MSYTASYIVNSSSAQGTTDFQFTFPYIKEEHIEVYLNYTKITQGSGSNQYQVITNVSPKLVRLNTGIASANLRVEVRRNSSLASPLVDYADGSTLTANDLDTSALQSLYIDQELKDNQSKTVSVDEATGLPSMGESGSNLRLTKVADPTSAQDAATKNYVDTKQFASAQIVDGTLVNADINASAAIAGTKINPDFGSQNIATSGTVDGRDVSADGSKLDGIETGATADQTNAEIRAAVEAASDSNVFTDADHTKLNAAATLTGSETLTNKTLTSPVINDMSGTAVVTSGTSTSDTKTYSAKRAGEIFYGKDTVGEIQSGETWSASDDKVATTSAIDARIIDLVDEVGGFVPIANETSFPNANPDINNGPGTLVSIKALSSNLTSDGSGVATISNGTVGNSTVTINGLENSTTYGSTLGMIVETTSTLNTYTFHRVTPKATEVTTVATNISAINSVNNNLSNINSVNSNASNINSAVSNASNINAAVANASNINSAVANASNINSAVSNITNINAVGSNANNINAVAGQILFSEDLGGITDSLATGTGNNINTVASNLTSVNAFAETYRIASSAPNSSLDEGDLWYDSTANVLKYYNGTAWVVTAAAGLSSISQDSSPELGGHLDCNDKNLTEVGTISGDNLQVDFGTLS